MQLADSLSDLIRASFSAIWIVSHEHDDALAEIGQLCHREGWRLAMWDLERGLCVPGQPSSTEGSSDSLAAIRSLAALASENGTAVLALLNFHRFLSAPEIVQALAHQISVGKLQRTFVVVIAPIVQIPPELDRQFIVLEHELPNRQQLLAIAQGLAEDEEDLPRGAELERLLDAAAGLSRFEAEGAFALSLTRHQRMTAEVIWELKSSILLKSGLVKLYRGDERFDGLGGLAALKAFALRALRKQKSPNTELRPRGVLLLGVPGTGKSAFAKALGSETERPTLTLDVGCLMGSLVGESERNVRQALKIVDAMAPAVVFIDEVEKGLSGIGGTGDSGVSTRLFGAILTWLNDHTSDVFVVATCNDIARLPPEFGRAERFDAIYFLDLPSALQKEAIWDLYVARFQLDVAQSRPDDEAWTGAEIRACCRLAGLLDLPLAAAALHIVPVARTAGEAVERLQQWAAGRCLDAERGGVYQPGALAPATRRRISRGKIDPSVN